MSKSKKITVALVVALCLLLVLAIGFGVTGAWYKAKRNAEGVIVLDQGIYLKVNHVGDFTDDNLTENGVKTTDLKVVQDNEGTLSLVSFNVGEALPGTTVVVANPTIELVQNAEGQDSINVHARAKVSYVFYTDDGAGNYTAYTLPAETVYYYAEGVGPEATNPDTYTTVATLDDLVAGKLTFTDNWGDVAGYDADYKYYTEGGAELAEIAVADGAIALFESAEDKTIDEDTVGTTTFELVNWVDEFGGIKLYTEDGGVYTEVAEITKVEISLDIEVIQAANGAAADEWVA